MPRRLSRCYVLSRPRGTPVPVVFDSPHSGCAYPADFRPVATRAEVLTSWDAHVEELWRGVTATGATLLSAVFPRAYVDPNRAAEDIDLTMLAEPWPGQVTPSGYGRRGMGVVRRCAVPGVAMYRRPLSLTEVRHRLRSYHVPYRRVLREIIDRVWLRYGAVWHFNCHSMKSRTGAASGARPDFAIGDRDGTTAPRALTAWVADFFRDRGYRVQINQPYRGGDIVRAHGQPRHRRYSLQIEINRALYMDETTFARGPRFRAVQADLTAFARAVGVRAVAEVGLNARG